MLKPIHLLFFRCLFLFGLAMNSAYAENEDVYLAGSLSDDIFHYYQQLAAQHDEEENDYTLIIMIFMRMSIFAYLTTRLTIRIV